MSTYITKYWGVLTMKKTFIIGILFIFCLFHVPCVEAKVVTLYVVPAITDNKILLNSSIPSSYISDTISVKVSPGEFESASFVVHANNDTESLTIKTSNLTSYYGEIQSSNVDIRVVKSWYQGGYTTTNLSILGRYLTPELLLKDDSLIKIEGEDWASYNTSNLNSKNFMRLNGSYIDISDDSNKSTGSVIIPISERPIQDAATLQPVSVKQDKNKQFWMTIYVPTGTLPGTYTGNITVRDSGVIINTITLNVMVLPIDLLEPNIEYSIYYRGYLTTNGSISSEAKTTAQFNAEMQDLINHGIKNPTVYASSYSQLTQMYPIRQQIGMNNSNLYCLGLTLNNANSISVVKNITSQYGVNDIFVYGPDEQSMNDPISRAKIDAIHAAGAKVFNAQRQSIAEDIADILDLAVVSGSPNSTLAEAYHDSNHKIFSYANPQTVPEYPKTFRLNYGFLLWQKDYDGVMDYTYQGSFRDIWNDFDHTTYRDHVFAYPTSNGVIDTIQWEGFREGVDDMRYLATLQRALMVNPSDTTAIEAQDYLNNLKNTSLSDSDLDTIRSQIIDYILLLESSSHKVSVDSGSGSGYYPKNSQNTINAYTPQSGMIFDKWVGDASYVSNVSASTTNVTVPTHSISLKATYKPSSNAWYDTNYSYRKLLTVNHTQVSNVSLSNFSVLLSLTDSDLKSVSNGGKIQYSNGRDIGFLLPDGTDMNYEVESYNNKTGKLIAWVRVPSLSAITDTFFYMYFGDSNAYYNTSQNINSVWDSNYKAVYHLGETGTGKAGDFKDSTSNSNNNKNVINQPYSTTGQIGNAQKFNGMNSSINVGNKPNLNLVNAFTISAWVNPAAFQNDAYTGIVWKPNNNDTSQNTAYGLTTYYYADQKAPELFATTSTGKGKHVYGKTKLQANVSQYIVATYNATSNKTIIYFNGVSDVTSSAITGTVNITSSDVYIGVRNKWFWNGTIDEVRISDIDRSPDWIRTEYNNQINPSLFISEGSTEVRPPIYNVTIVNESGSGDSLEIQGKEIIIKIQQMYPNLTSGQIDEAHNISTPTLNLSMRAILQT